MNLSKRLKLALPMDFKEIIPLISEMSTKFGANVFIIGGVVRDLLLNKQIYDIDFVVEGNAIEFARYMEANNVCKIVRISEDFGTVKVAFCQNDDFVVDFASTRLENYPKPGHLPVVEKIGCSLKEDVARRDFTVNTLAISLNPENFGKLIDYVGGLKDLARRELKILHEKSFVDDPTRIIRGLRFCHKLNFKFEHRTEKHLKDYIEKFDNEDICYERIKQVVKLAFNLNSSRLYDEFISKKMYKLLGIHPLCELSRDIEQTITKYQNDVAKDDIWLIYLATCSPFINVEKLHLSSQEAKVIVGLRILYIYNKSFKNDFRVYKFFSSFPIESIIAYTIILNEELAVKYLDELKDVKLSINGNDLINLGFQQGRSIRNALDRILEAKILKQIETKEDEINLAKKILLEF